MAEDNDVVSDEVYVKEYISFDEMNLPENLLRGINSHGFTKPSFPQSKGIVPIAQGKDIIMQARSGTGKTGTFVIGAMARIDPKLKKVQVLCLSPTRELANQTQLVASAIGESSTVDTSMNIKAYAAMGKTPLKEDIRAIDRGVQFLIGTPGRIFDLMNRRAFTTEFVKVIVIDEADQMLEDRFREQMQCIFNIGFPVTTRCAFFSATMNPDVVEFADSLLQDPVKILLPPEQVTLEGIKQFKVEVEREDWKFEVLLDLYKNLNIAQALIYCNTRMKAEELADKMTRAGYPISCIHGEMEARDRMTRMTSFRRGETRVLISTDLLARGIDVQQVSLVINYEMPIEMENYIHRIGRSGRFGRKGTSISILYGNDVHRARDIESFHKTEMTSLPGDLSQIQLNE
jgi:translation initiation factor 4A